MADKFKMDVKIAGGDSFEKLARTFTPAKRRQALRPGARIILNEIRQTAPVGTRNHAYYSPAKKNSKAANGEGKKLREFKPGNLKRSFAILNLRKSKDLFVGPRTGKKSPFDGYYAHLVEFGTSKMAAQPFIRPAVAAKREAAMKANVEMAWRIINNEVKSLTRRSR